MVMLAIFINKFVSLKVTTESTTDRLRNRATSVAQKIILMIDDADDDESACALNPIN